ncbi:MAG: hypothetical protein QXV22_02845 [Thermoplasmataceae archaeon]
MVKSELELAAGVKLSEQDVNNLEQLEGELTGKLLKVFREYSRSVDLKNDLMAQIARLNYAIYENFMDVHITAIRISGLLSIIRLTGIDLSEELKSRAQRILDEYLIIHFTDEKS